VTVSIEGTGQEGRAELEAALASALAELDWDPVLTVRLEVPTGEPAGAKGGANDAGLWFSPGWLAEAREAEIYSVACEEVAHRYLGTLGVPHTTNNLAIFYQELFGSWFALTQGMNHPSFQASHLKVMPMPKPGSDLSTLYYCAGTHIGAYFAGIALARSELEKWTAKEMTHPGENVLKQLVDHSLSTSEFSKDSDSVDLAQAVAEVYLQTIKQLDRL
jgi:hypothetical protein